MSRLLEPQVVLRERYRIVGPIGQGGMGAVYRAEDLLLPGRICAVKEIVPDGDIEPEVLVQIQEQFRQEAGILARLDHPNLPKVSDYFTLEGREYLVMDFVPGYDLRELVEQAREKDEHLDEQQVISWADQLCDALSYLHSQDPPIVHRDIKPSNIKLTPSGLIKLVDFGLVKLLTSDEARTITVVQGRGTAAFTPLEQYGNDDGHTNVQSDIYALGATLYNLLTGRPPATARERFLNPAALTLPRSLNPSLNSGIEFAILQALQLHPDDRPTDVQAFNHLLHKTYRPHRNGSRDEIESWKAALLGNLPLEAAALTLLLLIIILTP